MAIDQGPWTTPSHVLAAAIGLSVLDIITVTLRFIIRKKKKQPIKADDWLIIPAMLFTLGIAIAMVYGVATTGLAHPLVYPDNQPFGTFVTDQLKIEGAIQYSYMVLMPLALGCTKASFLFFYHRIFAVHWRGWNNIFLVSMIVLTFMWTVAFTLTFVFQCRLSMWAYWTSLPDIMEHCLNDGPFTIAFTVTDFAGDLIIFVIPIPMIWRLNLSLARKLSVAAVFLFGAVTVAVSLTRLILAVRIYYEAFNMDTDPILNVTAFVYWCMVECGMAVFTACLPNLAIFFTGGSWQRFLSAARSLVESGASGLLPLRSKTSKSSMSNGRTAGSGSKSSMQSDAATRTSGPGHSVDIVPDADFAEKGYAVTKTDGVP